MSICGIELLISLERQNRAGHPPRDDRKTHLRTKPQGATGVQQS
jgi:hypothetical protein